MKNMNLFLILILLVTSIISCNKNEELEQVSNSVGSLISKNDVRKLDELYLLLGKIPNISRKNEDSISSIINDYFSKMGILEFTSSYPSSKIEPLIKDYFINKIEYAFSLSTSEVDEVLIKELIDKINTSSSIDAE